MIGGWDTPLPGPADVILANPPYIPSDEVLRLAPEVVEYDPVAALDGGADGLSAYRALGPAIRRMLMPAGRAYIEVGAGQADAVATLFTEARLRIAAVKRDLAGIERCVVTTL